MANLNYNTTPGLNLLNVGTNELGLVVNGEKTTSGAPSIVPNVFEIGCVISSRVDGELYVNVGTVLAPEWSTIATTQTQVAIILVTSPELLNMFTTPVELIAAPGVGKFIVVDKAIMRYDFNSIAYTQPGNTNLVMNGQSIVQFGNVLSTGADFVRMATPTSILLTENSALNLVNTIGNLTNGNGTVTLYVYYSINSL